MAVLGMGLASAQATDIGPASDDARARDLPPVGRSLFDSLVTARVDGEPRYRVPFPFSALVRSLVSKVPGRSVHVRQVLIPLGRSLQRAAAAPEYFRSPRIVVAFDDDDGHSEGPLLKDRIYLGYQEAAFVVEVISYNEAAGRFEFQVVRDYRSGAVPSVRYANRALCTACHQNEAPMFSRRLWSETNANPQVGALLERYAETFHGVPARGSVDVAQAIDDATDRANLFSTWQTLWRNGCEIPGDEPRSRRCRADALILALAYRLGADPTLAPEYTRLSKVLDDTWRRRWPEGLEIPNGDLPNRDPLMAIERRAGTLPVSVAASDRLGLFVQALMRSNSIPSTLEPLNPRAPLTRWPGEDPMRTTRFVEGLASFLANADLKQIDDLLSKHREKSSEGLGQIDVACTFHRAERYRRISVECDDDGPQAVQLRARLYLANGKLTRGSVEHLSINAQALIDLGLTALAHGFDGTGRVINVTPRRRHDGLGVYLKDSRVVRSIAVRWPRSTGNTDSSAGRIALTLGDGLTPLRKAVNDMLSDGDAAANHPLGDGPFRRRAAIGALVQALGGTLRADCCRHQRELPPPLVDDGPLHGSQTPTDGIHAAFIEHCGQCHRSHHRSPPNFLAGGDAQIARAIRHCAERIHYRLQMWHHPGETGSKTPMPPANALDARQISVERWRTGAPLVSLTAHVRSLLEAEPDGAADRADALLERDYADLRACLPAGGLATANTPSSGAITTSKP